MERHIHIIHLPDREDRLEKLRAQLIEQNITGCIWPGIPDTQNPKRGIAKAHKQIVQYAKDQNLTEITIAEDDIKFTAPGAFTYFLNHTPERYDLYLGGIYYGKIKTDNAVAEFAGLMLYRIHQRFYDTFLSLPEESDIDRELGGKGLFYVCNPFIALQHDGYSDNKKKFMNYDCYLKDVELFHG